MTGLGPTAILRGLAVGLLVVAWAVLAHYGSAGDSPSDLSAALACAPLLAIVVIVLWRVGSPLRVALGGLVVLAVLVWQWPLLRQNIALLYFIQHVGTNLALGALFGRTLLKGRVPLVTHFARLAHDGIISPLKEKYTRRVTIAWASYFMLTALISTILFVFAPASVWSTFANLLGTVLIALMFVIEHLVRLRALPPEDQSSIADTIRGYRLSTRQKTESS
ncbi:hypothetical protein KI614_16145 [Dechloromonas denitrificans]|uniref:COG4648 family protein n=1 Tax=Dechloromonas denitrificans TaxID=281362 RepID=UPI001CF86B43|nr:hypothetical protein [Dechloromonas denitrificans]UCV11642.1 hypothetical protein KI614_16145 [Dechloromonas denitrificans]